MVAEVCLTAFGGDVADRAAEAPPAWAAELAAAAAGTPPLEAATPAAVGPFDVAAGVET